jgi:O-antigen/teichoic acid export membrane protein
VTKHRIVLMGSILSIANIVATMAVGFFLMPFIVHGLGDRMFGYWALVGTVLGYYGILDLGISPAVSFQVAKAIGKGDTESPNRVLSTAGVAFAVLGFVVLAVTIVVAASCQFFIRSTSDVGVFRTVLVITGAGFALGFPGRAFMGGLYAHLRNDLIASIGIIGLILRSSLIIAVILKGKGIIGLAVVSLVTEAAMYVANYLILRRIQKGLRISLALADKKVLRELLNYGGYSMIIRIGDQLRFAVDSWMVAGFVGIIAVAHYSIASRLSGFFLSFILSAGGALQSWFSQLLGGQNHEGIRKTLAFGTKAATSLSTIVLCSFALYGRAFIVQWMGPSYIDAYWPSLILISALYCDLAQQPSVAYLLGVSRHRYLAFQTLAEGVANLALSMLLAPHYGMVGVALGTFVPMIVAKVVLQPAFVCRQIGVSLFDYYVRVLGQSAIVPGVTALSMWVLLQHSLDQQRLAGVCAIVLVQASACALSAFLFVFDREDRCLILSKLATRRKMTEQAQAHIVLTAEPMANESK